MNAALRSNCLKSSWLCDWCRSVGQPAIYISISSNKQTHSPNTSTPLNEESEGKAKCHTAKTEIQIALLGYCEVDTRHHHYRITNTMKFIDNRYKNVYNRLAISKYTYENLMSIVVCQRSIHTMRLLLNSVWVDWRRDWCGSAKVASKVLEQFVYVPL